MLVGRRQVPGLVVDDHGRIRDMAGQPFSVAGRHQHVACAVSHLHRDPDLLNLESPRFDERQVVVDPAQTPDPSASRNDLRIRSRTT